MGTLNAVRISGPTYALSVANTQHSAVAILPSGKDQCSFAMFQNSGAVDICIVVSPLPASGTPATPALVFPVDGTPTIPDAFIAHANSAGSQPLIVAVPANGFSVSAIGASAGPSIIYVTPVTRV